MNGRVYDYNLGRFMSVDPFVHGGSQGLNPYSYIFNNPLSGTDPSGYTPEAANTENERKLVATTAGSRIKRTITVSVSESSGAVNVSGGSASSVWGAMNTIASGMRTTISNMSADLGNQDSIADQNPAKQTTSTPAYLDNINLVGGNQLSDFNEETQEALMSADEQIENYAGALERAFLENVHNGYESEIVQSILEAKEALGNTDFYYLDKTPEDGAAARAGIRVPPEVLSNGQLDRTGDRVVIFYRGAIKIFEKGAPEEKIDGGEYVYAEMRSGGSGMFDVISHEVSHTMVSRMYDSNNAQMPHDTATGHEYLADQWMLFMREFE